MKKYLMLLAIATLSVGCNKMFDANYAGQAKNQPVTLSQGQYFTSYAGTYKSEPFNDVIKDANGNEQRVTSVHHHSNSADGSWNAWDEVEALKGSFQVGYKYNFQSGTYTVTVKDGNNVIELKLNNDKPAGEIVVESNGEGQTFLKFTPVDENGNLKENEQVSIEITSQPDPTKPEQVYSNGTWVVNEFIATTHSATLTKKGLDLYEFASWGKNSVGLDIKDSDLAELEGYKTTNVVITDSSISINFVNGKSFCSKIDITKYNGFQIESLDPNDNLGKYINGTASFTFSKDLCVLSIAGTVKENEQAQGTDVTMMLTLKRAK